MSNKPQELCCWHGPSHNGAFQKWVDVGNGEMRLWSHLLETKPVFDFKFDSMEYIPEVGRYTIDGNSKAMTEKNKHFIKKFIESLEPPKEWFIQQKSTEHLRYLHDTDWYVIRKMDNGKPVPAEIKAQREHARYMISLAREK